MKVEFELDTDAVINRFREVIGYEGPIDPEFFERALLEDIKDCTMEVILFGDFLKEGWNNDRFFEALKS